VGTESTLIALETEKKVDVQLRQWKGPFPLIWIDQLKAILEEMYTESLMEDHSTKEGFITYTMNQITLACSGQGELWICTDGKDLLGYLLSVRDFGIMTTYIVKQAWVHKSIRRTPKVKEMLSSILLNAKSNFCQRALIVATRNEKAYLRWLGKDWSKYTTTLKGEL
jgi:hypothetical protein